MDDLNDFYKERKANGLVDKISNDDALAIVRDKWIKEGKLTELISFIHTNWDSGNCDDFIEPLTALLIETKQVDLFKKLWIRVLKYRITSLWNTFDDFKKQAKNVDPTEIATIDTSNFNISMRDSYNDLKRVLAFRRQFTVDGLTKFRDGLLKLNQKNDSNKVINFITNVNNLKRSTFKL